MKTISQKIHFLKNDFKKGVEKNNLSVANLKAVFNIGSVANNKNNFNNFYQDFDIHFYFNNVEIEKKYLKKIRKIFKDISKKYNKKNTAVDFAVKDSPWKMIPQKKQNIGIHGTLLNSLDFQRRINRNYILALNMFHNSELLYGSLDYPLKKITKWQFLSEVGGMGWLKELFYKIIPIVDLNNNKFYPVINDLCFYFTSSSLLHFFYLCNKDTTTRKKSYDFFMKSKKIPITLKEKVGFIYSNRFIISESPEYYNEKLNYTFGIMNFIEELFINKKKLFLNKNKFIIDEESLLISQILGRRIKLQQIHYFFNHKNLDDLRESILRTSKKTINSTSDDYIDALYNIILKNLKEVNRLYFWSNNKPYRLFNKIDYSLNNKKIRICYFLDSWEKGLTTFIQRLHEIYINNEKINFSQVKLAKILAIISYKNHLKLNNFHHLSYKKILKIIKNNENIDLENQTNKLTHEKQYFLFLKLLYCLANKYTKRNV